MMFFTSIICFLFLESSMREIGAALVAQIIKNLPAMQEIQIQSLGGEDPLEKGMAPHCSIPDWRIP